MPSFCFQCKKNHKMSVAVNTHDYGDATDNAFTDLIRLAFTKGREKHEAERLKERGTLDKQTMYLSDAGTECMRQLVLGRMPNPNITNPPDIFSLMNFAVGNAVQDAVAKVLGYLGAEVWMIEEDHVTIVHDDMKATGRSDVLIDVPAEVLRVLELVPREQKLPEHNLLEVKATGESAMISMISNGERGRDSHIRQLNEYMHASHLGLMPEGRIYSEALLAYFVPLLPKGEPNIFVFRHEYNPARATGDLDFMAHAERLALKGEVPPIPVEFIQARDKNKKKQPPNWPCGYCSFRDGCWEGV